MTPDPTTATRTRTATPGSAPGATVVRGATDVLGTAMAPGTASARGAPKRGGFASASVPRHLARGAVGFGALVASLALLPAVGPVSLLLAPVGLIALRGCPMCWAIGLVETISAGRLRRSCEDGRCELTRAKP
ncbi:hypothetical protein AB0I00_02570 [Streptomyces sp. NPDC050803]|uniref:hypothetical protein n=1 Tax=unclassified Streptomyces TaxID=2593676 RepID=UPI0034443D05